MTTESITNLNVTKHKIEWQFNRPISDVHHNIQQYNPGKYNVMQSTSITQRIDNNTTQQPQQQHSDTSLIIQDNALEMQHKAIQNNISRVSNIISFNNETQQRVSERNEQSEIDAYMRYNALPQSAKNYLNYLFGHLDIYKHMHDNDKHKLTEAEEARMRLLSYALKTNVNDSNTIKQRINNSTSISDLLNSDEFNIYKQAVRQYEHEVSRIKANTWKVNQQVDDNSNSDLKHKSLHSSNKQQATVEWEAEYTDVTDSTINDNSNHETAKTNEQPQQLTNREHELKDIIDQLKQFEYIPSICQCIIDIHHINSYNTQHIHNVTCQYHNDTQGYIDMLIRILKNLQSLIKR